MEGRELSTDAPGLLMVVGVDGTFIQGFSSGIFLRFCVRGMQSYLEREEKKKVVDDLMVSLDQIPDRTHEELDERCR